MFEEKFFAHRKVNIDKLSKYGFTKKSDGYQYSTAIMNRQLELSVFVAADGSVSTKVIDVSTGEEYLLYKVTSSVGAYVGEVRAECEGVLTDISEKCFDPDIFHCEQTLAVIEYVREKYGDELEFLWEKFPDNAIWRRKDNQKWYGLLITVSKRKLGLDSDEIVEAMDLRLQPQQMAEIIDNEKYFPGWHMNKKNWYTVILDGLIPTDEICRRIDESYGLAKR
ncbi:MAG: MmcQ/YjbR family DNA-binding protein [Oscillospiraceae bacterium]|nr:MmcQ/YjbR family DNA-binding protein [Oscillospiraceae bacterium]